MDSELAAIADPSLDQHFLVSESKLAMVVEAAGIRSADRVVELGAGAGTVARALPKCKSLTVVEFDERLVGILRKNVPHAQVIQGDALDVIKGLHFDVLIGNLPHWVSEHLLTVLPSLAFRTAVLAVGQSSSLEALGRDFRWRVITEISGDDFTPPQEQIARVVRVSRESA
jgi:16S rRNA A1518/A1519 N6-dimethyltransferase RsmA/KsgA/DIM1 with predicted DNA glycosylase/AP lyase activity